MIISLPDRLMTNKNLPKAYTDILEIWESQNFESEATDYQNFLHNNSTLDIVLNAGPSLTIIMDMRTSSYVYVSRNSVQILGYSSEEIMAKGLQLTLALIHPDDLKEYIEVTKVIWEFLIALPIAQRKHYKTSVDFRIKNKEEVYKRVLQQNTALQTDNSGNIVLLLMVLSDISHLKKENGISAAIISTKHDGFLVWDASDTQLKSQIGFSRREREIIKFLAEGYSSKQVAEQLNVSEYTVSTHRRNMLKKTRLSNTRALVRFAINHGMI
jgi:DNA-binding CsgD family transcriptional regulator/PAS domain-containing protein